MVYFFLVSAVPSPLSSGDSLPLNGAPQVSASLDIWALEEMRDAATPATLGSKNALSILGTR